MSTYSVIVLKGPGMGTIWNDVYQYFPFRVVTKNKAEHENVLNLLNQKNYIYEIVKHPPEIDISVSEKEKTINVTVNEKVGVSENKKKQKKKVDVDKELINKSLTRD